MNERKETSRNIYNNGVVINKEIEKLIYYRIVKNILVVNDLFFFSLFYFLFFYTYTYIHTYIHTHTHTHTHKLYVVLRGKYSTRDH